MRILVLVVSDQKKEHSSTSGQETSVATSLLLAHRADAIVEARMKAIENAIQERNFAAFGQLTMQDSNQFHAVCLDTYPPIFYLNETSRAIIRLITNFNAVRGTVKAAYTFDAGPNAVLFVEDDDLPALAAAIRRAFPPGNGVPAGSYLDDFADVGLDDKEFTKLDCTPRPDALKYIISTTVGDGPRCLETPSDLTKEYPGYTGAAE